MKNNILFQMLVVGAIAFSSCKKDKETSVLKPEPDAQTLTQVEDNNDSKSESDQANTDVTDALDNFKSISGGRVAVVNERKIICGCSIDSVGSRTIRLSYDGETPCGNPSRTRSGTITFQLVEGNQWKFPGAKVKITLNNYKVTKLSNQKSWTFNGVKYITNVRGHLNWSGYLERTDSLLYRERAKDIKITLNSGKVITYNVARTTSLKYVRYSNRDVIQFAANGDTTFSDLQLSNVDSWGSNQFGNSFTSNYLTRLISDSYCFFWRPKSGTILHKANGNSVTLTFGVNENGNADTRDCAYGWKLNWSISNGIVGDKIISY